MTEFAATLQAFMRLAQFENQSAYAKAAKVAGSTITRATSGRSFSENLLCKLIRPFDRAKQIELVRAFLRDRLKDGNIPTPVTAAALGSETDSLARFRPEVRMLALQIAVSVEEDPAFQKTLENLLQLIGGHAGLLPAEAKVTVPKIAAESAEAGRQALLHRAGQEGLIPAGKAIPARHK